MCKVGITEFSEYYYPECPFANLDDVHILDCLCIKLEDDNAAVGKEYWCSTAQTYKKCPMDVKKNV